MARRLMPQGKWRWSKEKIRFAQRSRDPSWNTWSPKICVRDSYTT